MSVGQSLVLKAAKKELIRLSNAAQKKAAEVQSVIDASTKIIALNDEVKTLLYTNKKITAVERLKRLEEIDTERSSLRRTRNKDINKLMTIQFDLEDKCRSLAKEIMLLELRYLK